MFTGYQDFSNIAMETSNLLEPFIYKQIRKFDRPSEESKRKQIHRKSARFVIPSLFCLQWIL